MLAQLTIDPQPPYIAGSLKTALQGGFYDLRGLSRYQTLRKVWSNWN
jgi:hypothetical protein